MTTSKMPDRESAVQPASFPEPPDQSHGDLDIADRRPRDALKLSAIALLGFLKDWSPHAVLLVSALWTASTYFATQRDAERGRVLEAQKLADARLAEARKPFLEAQFKAFQETLQVASKLAHPDISPEEWKKQTTRFFELRWGEVAMMGNESIRQAMQVVSVDIMRINRSKPVAVKMELPNLPLIIPPPSFLEDPLSKKLRVDVECLSSRIRESLEQGWGQKLSLNSEKCNITKADLELIDFSTAERVLPLPVPPEALRWFKEPEPG